MHRVDKKCKSNLVGRTGENRPLNTLMCRREDNIKMNPKKCTATAWTEFIYLPLSPATGSSENIKEPSGYITCVELFDQRCDSWCLKTATHSDNTNIFCT
jgi:hypothetical protein